MAYTNWSQIIEGNSNFITIDRSNNDIKISFDCRSFNPKRLVGLIAGINIPKTTNNDNRNKIVIKLNDETIQSIKKTINLLGHYIDLYSKENTNHCLYDSNGSEIKLAPLKEDAISFYKKYLVNNNFNNKSDDEIKEFVIKFLNLSEYEEDLKIHNDRQNKHGAQQALNSISEKYRNNSILETNLEKQLDSIKNLSTRSQFQSEKTTIITELSATKKIQEEIIKCKKLYEQIIKNCNDYRLGTTPKEIEYNKTQYLGISKQQTQSAPQNAAHKQIIQSQARQPISQISNIPQKQNNLMIQEQSQTSKNSEIQQPKTQFSLIKENVITAYIHTDGKEIEFKLKIQHFGDNNYSLKIYCDDGIAFKKIQEYSHRFIYMKEGVLKLKNFDILGKTQVISPSNCSEISSPNNKVNKEENSIIDISDRDIFKNVENPTISREIQKSSYGAKRSAILSVNDKTIPCSAFTLNHFQKELTTQI